MELLQSPKPIAQKRLNISHQSLKLVDRLWSAADALNFRRGVLHDRFSVKPS
jgi:hypothetical protein